MESVGGIIFTLQGIICPKHITPVELEKLMYQYYTKSNLSWTAMI